MKPQEKVCVRCGRIDTGAPRCRDHPAGRVLVQLSEEEE